VTANDPGLVPSLLIPGFHEFRRGGKRGYIYAVSEAVIISYYGISSYERRTLLNYSRSYVFEHAGTLLPTSYNESWRVVESSISYEDYVEDLYRTARQMYPDDPAKQDEYVEMSKPNYHWNWDGSQSFLEFQNLMRRYRGIGSRKTIALGLIVLNHLASGIDYLVSKSIKSAGLDVDLKTYLGPQELTMSLNYRF